MSLTRWDPFETLTSLQDDIDSIFNRKLRLKGNKGNFDVSTDWLPAVDIHEDSEAFLFDVEAPGVDKDNFDIKIEDNILTIKGERKKEEEKKDKNYYRVEREFGSFMRSFTLPETADAERVDADYKDGVLKLKIAKKEAAKPKKIAVNVK